MRLIARQRFRLVARDLAAASAFAAVALTGALPVAVPAAFGLALIASLFGFRPFARQGVASVLLLLFTAVGLFGLSFRGQLDLVVAAVSFATLVTGQRMLTEPTAATDQQVLLASLLLMAGAAALSGDVSYALCLLSFGVFGCLALGLAVVEGPVERDEELPLRPVLRQISIGVTLALAGGVAFFILFPRLSWNLAARRTSPGLLGGTTGMSDRVTLGGGGDIKTSARVVLRATLEPRPRVERLEQYWVGRRFDSFDGREWRGTGIARGPRPRIFIAEPTGAITQRIELLPAYDSRTLVGLREPVVYGPATALTTTGSTPTQLERLGDEEVHFVDDANAYTYVVQSLPGRRTLEERAEVLEALRALPETIDPRVGQLAASIVGNKTSAEDVAPALERWLRSNLDYTLELPGEVTDPLADFLFSRKAGHCEHFATALAVMLRIRGVPARVVGGFFGGELIGSKYVVRAGDAHAWVEAYLPTQGWTTFDATPDDGRGSRPPGAIARLVDAWERLEDLWRSRVVDYSIIDQWQFVKTLVRPPRDAEAAGSSGASTNARTSPAAVVSALGAGFAVWLGWRLLTRRRVRAHPATAFLHAVERRLDEAGITRSSHEDLEWLAERLVREGHRLATTVQAISRRYVAARYGGRPMTREEQALLISSIALEK